MATLPSDLHGNVKLSTPVGRPVAVCAATYQKERDCDLRAVPEAEPQSDHRLSSARSEQAQGRRNRAGDLTTEILAFGQRVRCHKNLPRGDWSTSDKGKVVAHVTEITPANLTFKIRETACQRVIANKCREVAFDVI